MNMKEEDRVSAVALVVESEASSDVPLADVDLADGPVDLATDSGGAEGPADDPSGLGGDENGSAPEGS
jgi:hypothetical protein